MKTVLRIEHPASGNGIWRHDENGIDVCENFSFYEELCQKHSRFPNPWEEGINIEYYEFCAFKSIEQVKEWINSEWMNEIIDFGFKVYMVDLSKYKEGKFQIVFDKNDILQQKDVTSLFLNK